MPDLPELPPVANEPISLILFAHNAANDVSLLIPAWREVLLARAVPFEILFVDDGSDEVATAIPEVKLLRHERPRGIGACLRTGLEAASQPLIVFAPCHPNYRPEHLARFLVEMDKVHLLTGYRAAMPIPLTARFLGTLRRWLWRLLFSVTVERSPGWLGWKAHFGAVLARLFFGVRLHDVACPFRVFRREVIARSPIQSDGVFGLVEQLAKVNFAGYLLGQEIPLAEASAKTLFPGQPNGHVLREARRLFAKPTFGPAIVETGTSGLTGVEE